VRATHLRSQELQNERQLDIPLPAELENMNLPKSGLVALVDVGRKRLTLRFLCPLPVEGEASLLTEAEEAELARGGVEPATRGEAQLVSARAEAGFQSLRTTSLSVVEAAQLLGVNASRIRQRLAERSLYGFKDRNIWRLPAFQFFKQGLVPGIEGVVRKVPPDMSPVAVARWFNSPNPDLCTRDDDERSLTPLRWLLAGNPPEAAAELAAAL
jgi:hypothetical protein